MPFACALSRGRSFFGGAGASLSTGGGLNSGSCFGVTTSMTAGVGGLCPTLDGNNFSLVEVGVGADVGVDGAMLGFLPPIFICGFDAFGIILMLGVIGNVGSGEATSIIGVGGRCIVTFGIGSSTPRTARSASFSMHHRTS